ncbi:PREDICTED: cell wall integrity and stress response component 2-like [Polistes dominula]|uniref:Cell wall integrity and stress response component 2-like n=1 Tax=Polistes dominula TaxID=743375 RepID=A0ABM1IB45_POLDO|nr:PREDICTED: cell wall integrity and stress response component 2-like [Polistes dominula]
MFQLSLKILLATLMFVNLVFTTPVEDSNLVTKKSINMVFSADVENITNEHKTFRENKHLKEGNTNVTLNSINHPKTSSNIGESSTKTLPATFQNNSNPIPPVLEKKKDDDVNQNATKRPVEETTPINQVTEIKNASDFTGEQKDLIGVSVSPRDEEDVTTIVPTLLDKTNSSVVNVTEATISSSSSLSPVSSTTSASSTTTLKSINETTPVDDVPIKKEKPDSEHKDKVENTTYQINTSTTTTTATVSSNITTEMKESSSVTSKSTEEVTTVVSSESDQVEIGISTEVVEKKKNVVEEKIELNIKSKPLSANEKDSNGGMPPGIIVLVTAFVFAVTIVIGYISMVVWKQYLQHRYGRRELLVNELEFDTNDLRHFEL